MKQNALLTLADAISASLSGRYASLFRRRDPFIAAPPRHVPRSNPVPVTHERTISPKRRAKAERRAANIAKATAGNYPGWSGLTPSRTAVA